MTHPRRCSIVVPCFNEELSLARLVGDCMEVAKKGDIEFVLVNNGSSDQTGELIDRAVRQSAGIRGVHVERNQGYGYGILQGLAASDGMIVGWTHADAQTHPGDVLKALELFDHDQQQLFVKGRRMRRPLRDEVFTVGMSVFESALLRSRLWDINAQPTLFPASFFKSWVNPPTDFSLDLYAYHRAKVKGLQVSRIPVSFEAREFGQSRWNTGLKAQFRFARRTMKYSYELRRSISE